MTQPTQQPVRVAVVGVGGFGRMHARTLHGLAEAHLSGAVDIRSESIERLRADIAGVPAWDNIECALRECDAEAWVVATRTDSHVRLAEQILAAGKAVLVEKPLAADLATAKRLEPLVAPDSSNLMMGHIVLFASKFRRLLLEARQRGPILHFHAVRHRSAQVSRDYPEEDPLRFTMVHDLYLALALMEGQEPTSLSAGLRPRGDGGFDLALAHMQWPGGTWGTFTASFLTPPGMPGDGIDRFEIFGEAWAARLDLNPQPLQVWDEKCRWPMGLEIDDDPAAPSGWLAEELRHFCRVVRGRAVVPVGARFVDALQVQDWIERLEKVRPESRLNVLSQASRERDFPTLSGMTYLNTAAEGIPPRVVGPALEQYFKYKQEGNASRPRLFGMRETLKQVTAAMYGLSAEEIGICSCSAEAYNLAATALRLKDGDEVIITDLEFPSGATPWLLPANRESTKIWRNVGGALRIEDLIPLLRPRTRFVSVSAVSFLNGFMISVPRVVEAVRKHSGALLAVDVTQALGRVPLDLHGVDLIVSSTHKWILGSHGGGLVGVPKGSADRLHVQAGGWFNLNDAFGPQRFDGADVKPGAAGFSAGMPNFPAIFAIAVALEYIRGIGVENIDKAARPLVLHCLAELAKLPVELITPREPEALAGIIAFKHPAFEAIEARLRHDNIHIMAHAGRLRVSLHGYNTPADVERFLRNLKEALDHV